MKSKVLTLIKYDLINKLKLDKLNKNKKVSLLLFSSILFLIIFAISFLYMLLMAISFKQIQMTNLIVLMGFVMSQIMILISTIPSIESTLFSSKNYEILMSLPLKPKDIIISKLVVLLLMSYLVTILMAFTSLLCYVIIENQSVIVLLKGLFATLISPIISFSLSILISLLITKISLNFKYKKLISTVFSLIFILAIVIVMLFVSKVDGDDYTQVYNTYIKVFSTLSYPGYLLYQSIISNFLYSIIVFVISICLFSITILYVSLNYNKIIYKIKAKEQISEKTHKNKINTKLSSLVKLELKKYFSIPNYVLNTIVGPILGLVFLIFFIINLKDVLVWVPQINDYLEYTLLIIIILFSSISPQTSTTFSLEKNTLWIYKSMPIEEKYIFISKSIVCILLTLPFTIINSIICIIAFKLNISLSIAILITPILLVLLISNLGLLINLFAPSLNWSNPIEAIKQSKSVLLSMIAGLILSVLTIASSIFFASFFNLTPSIGIYITDIILVGLIVLSCHLLNTYGVRKYRNLVC